MSEAPERIWAENPSSPRIDEWTWMKVPVGNAVEYIRADIIEPSKLEIANKAIRAWNKQQEQIARITERALAEVDFHNQHAQAHFLKIMEEETK